MISLELSEILCCAETRQALRLAEPALIEKINGQIAAGVLRNRSGRLVNEFLDGGLVRSDGQLLYTIRGSIPVMLPDEAIPLGGQLVF